MNVTTRKRGTDHGSVLLIVLVVVVVLAAVVVAIAKYTTNTLVFGQVAESRGDRLAAGQAGMDDALEQLSLRQGLSICATSAGAAGVSRAFPETVNGAKVDVTCQLTSGSLPSSEGFALVVTGVGVTGTTPTLEFNNGDKPEIDGPVFISDRNRIDFQQPTTIVEGDLWFPDAACADPSGTNPDVTYARTTGTVPQLSFEPALTRGYYCVNRSWSQLFGAPSTDPGLSGLAPPASGPTLVPGAGGDCLVWEPGYYNFAPTLATNNYFKSGVYRFDDIGPWVYNKNVSTFGNALIPGFPVIDNTPCDGPRGLDATTGATVYVSGNTQFDMDKTATGIEIAGRVQGSQRVAVHVLSTSLNPNTEGLFISGNGGGREIALNGVLWAPESALIFDTIPTKKAAALRGGAVVARLTGKISGAAEGFVIEVPSASSSALFLLESTAVNQDGSTKVRVVADYRANSGQIAVQSWRVCETDGC